MSENTAFSPSGEDVITRTVDVVLDKTADTLSPKEFDKYYDIHETQKWIIDADYRKVALQFPDELLHHSVPIYRRLKELTGERDLYILADTSYGSCCVDEVAAEHVSVTAIVHYGHACLSQSSRLPVMYIFGKKPIQVDSCVESVVQNLPANTPLTIRHDVAYAHATDSIASKLEARIGAPVTYTPIPRHIYPNANNPERSTISETPTMLYIGSESLGLTNLLITHSSSTIYSYDPVQNTTRLESTRTNKMLMRRYAVVQKARDADVFGILVGTLGVASYLPLIKHLRSILRKAQKKSYTISVGKLNPAKLANFMEIECFVLVACPENSLIDAKDFLRPIVTPFELEIALQIEPNWTGKYVLNFGQLLADSELRPEETRNGDEDEEDRPMFSLISGSYRQAKRYGASGSGNQPASTSQALTVRDSDGALIKLPDSAAGEFLEGRVYRGLEPRFGEDAPGVLEQGRTGRAAEYDDDHPPSLRE